MRISVTKQFQLSSGHHLPNYQGRCADRHGHTYVLEITITGKRDEYTGMVVDFHDIKNMFEESIDRSYDHVYLNDVCANPTAENIAVDLFHYLRSKWEKLSNPGEVTKIKLWENPLHGSGSWVEVENG